MLKLLTEQISRTIDLSVEEIRAVVRYLVDPAIVPLEKADFLSALSRKGETVAEITAFARELRALSLEPPLDPATRGREILDVCGTGGDHLNTFNISTAVALVAAAAGVTVAKHGNRAVTSRCGSADVLEALAIRTDLTPADAAHSLRDHRFAFFFAPRYHPAFQHIAPARKLCGERGQRTLFHFLGPLLNPARPTAQLVGVPHPEWCELLARVMQSLGVRRGMVVAGSVPESPPPPGPPREAGRAGGKRYLDELSPLGENTVAEYYQDRALSLSTLDPEPLGARRARLQDLAGGDANANAAIIQAVLSGEDRGPKRDAVLLNAAAALFVAGQVKSLTEGWTAAGEVIDGGAARRQIEVLQEFSRAAD